MRKFFFRFGVGSRGVNEISDGPVIPIRARRGIRGIVAANGAHFRDNRHGVAAQLPDPLYYMDALDSDLHKRAREHEIHKPSANEAPDFQVVHRSHFPLNIHPVLLVRCLRLSREAYEVLIRIVVVGLYLRPRRGKDAQSDDFESAKLDASQNLPGKPSPNAVWLDEKECPLFFGVLHKQQVTLYGTTIPQNTPGRKEPAPSPTNLSCV